MEIEIEGVDILTIKKLKTFACSICGKMFSNFRGRRNHINKAHNKNKLYKCEKCHKVYAWLDLIHHILRFHRIRKLFKCEICYVCCGRNNLLKEHIASTHAGKKQECSIANPNPCKICRQVFSQVEKLNVHIKLMHPGKKYDLIDLQEKQENFVSETRESQMGHISVKTDKDCDKVLIDKEDGKECVLTSTKAKQKVKMFYADGMRNECEYCHELFSKRDKLNRHVKLFHKWMEQHECEICHEILRKNCLFKTHKRVHALKKVYPCDICSESFFQKSCIDKHMLTHTKVIPLPCDVCNRLFSEKKYLDKHMLNHTLRKRISCEICHKLFSLKKRKKNLRDHITTHLEENYHKCKICNRLFASKMYLEIHTMLCHRKKTHECPVCHELFKVKVKLDKHKLICTEKEPKQCAICHDYLFVKSHVKPVIILPECKQDDISCVRKGDTKGLKLKYINTVAHVCYICKKVFSSKCFLDKHMNIHTEIKPHDCEICQKIFPMDKMFNCYMLTQANDENYPESYSKLGSMKMAFCRLAETHILSSSHNLGTCDRILHIHDNREN